jgi:hypothetical protein
MPMLTVTERAKKQLSQVLYDAAAPGKKALRLMFVADGVRMILDEQQSEDLVVRYEDQSVLLLDPDIAKKLEDKTLEAGQRGELFFK